MACNGALRRCADSVPPREVLTANPRRAVSARALSFSLPANGPQGADNALATCRLTKAPLIGVRSGLVQNATAAPYTKASDSAPFHKILFRIQNKYRYFRGMAFWLVSG